MLSNAINSDLEQKENLFRTETFGGTAINVIILKNIDKIERNFYEYHSIINSFIRLLLVSILIVVLIKRISLCIFLICGLS